MDLSMNLIKQFAEAVNDGSQEKKSESSTLMGTVVKSGESLYVTIDGSDVTTPVTSTTDVVDGERVYVTIKNHQAFITGNFTSPSARSKDVQDLKLVVADKVDTKELKAIKADITKLQADNVSITGKLTANEAAITDLKAENVTINNKLTANDADIKSLQADNVTINGKLTANETDISNLKADNAIISGKVTANEGKIASLEADVVTVNGKIEANSADISTIKADNVTINNTLTAVKGNITDLTANKADIDLANVNNIWIQNGLIKDGSIGSAAIGDGAITNAKIADATIEAAKINSINADNIIAGTVKTERLIITGPDGQDSIVKAINIANGVSEAEVNGQKIQAASIEVADLSAFKAKIAGFDMNGNAIYSGKESIKDPKSGIYISTTGIGMGDGSLTGKDEAPMQAYADGSFKLIGKNSLFDFNTVTGELNIEADSFKVASKTVATSDDVEELRDEITTLLRIESSRGTTFKNNAIATVLSVVIYHGKQRIEDSKTMKEVFGSGAYLQWYWQRLDDNSYGVLSSDDSRFTDEGFHFTISPADVDVKTDFRCELIV